MRRFAVFALLLSAIACPALADDYAVERLRPEGLLSSPMFSQVTTVVEGKLIFVSGQVSWDAKGQVLHPGDLRAQTRQTFENMKTALAAAGANFENVLKFNIYVVGLDRDKWKVVGEERAKFINPDKAPASTMVGVPSLVLADLLIEIEAVAVIPD